ncbi:hypothetical protein [Mesomycoplasma neurolyticum]|nr:hypothetical protein [Mesomycoplasma neurolyticum]
MLSKENIFFHEKTIIHWISKSIKIYFLNPNIYVKAFAFTTTAIFLFLEYKYGWKTAIIFSNFLNKVYFLFFKEENAIIKQSWNWDKNSATSFLLYLIFSKMLHIFIVFCTIFIINFLEIIFLKKEKIFFLKNKLFLFFKNLFYLIFYLFFLFLIRKTVSVLGLNYELWMFLYLIFFLLLILFWFFIVYTIAFIWYKIIFRKKMSYWQTKKLIINDDELKPILVFKNFEIIKEYQQNEKELKKYWKIMKTKYKSKTSFTTYFLIKQQIKTFRKFYFLVKLIKIKTLFKI